MPATAGEWDELAAAVLGGLVLSVAPSLRLHNPHLLWPISTSLSVGHHWGAARDAYAPLEADLAGTVFNGTARVGEQARVDRYRFDSSTRERVRAADMCRRDSNRIPIGPQSDPNRILWAVRLATGSESD